MFDILDSIMRLNRDNGKRFTRTDRNDECLPVRGNIHSDRGVLAPRAAFDAYRSAISAVLADW